MKRIFERVVISGEFVDIVRFEKGILVGESKAPKPEQGERKEQEPGERIGRSERSMRRSFSQLTRLVNANPDLISFWTLTFAQNVTDVEVANREFRKFWKRVKRRYPDAEYIVGREFQKRGAVHFHLLVNIEWINNEALEAIWGQGFVKAKAVYNRGALGIYFGKYLSKGIDGDERYSQMRAWTASKGIRRPVVIDDPDITRAIIEGLVGSHEEYERDAYEHKILGGVKIERYRQSEEAGFKPAGSVPGRASSG